MTIGPVHRLVLGSSRPDFYGDPGRLQRLKVNDLVRAIDALAVQKDAHNVSVLHQNQLSDVDVKSDSRYSAGSMRPAPRA